MTDVAKKLCKRWGEKYVDKRDWPVYNRQLVKRGEYFLDLDWVEGWDAELDGMNEVDLEKPVLQYIKSVGDSTKCILTSQLLPKYWDVPVFKLESPDANMSMKLVAAFLNDCNEIECSLPSNLVNSDIWDSLQSAYECKLIAALVRQNNKIPHDKIKYLNNPLVSIITFSNGRILEIECETIFEENFIKDIPYEFMGQRKYKKELQKPKIKNINIIAWGIVKISSGFTTSEFTKDSTRKRFSMAITSSFISCL